MAEDTTTNIPDLTAIINEQQETLKTLTKQLSSTDSPAIFNTSPTTNLKAEPRDFLTPLLIGVVIFLIIRRK